MQKKWLYLFRAALIVSLCVTVVYWLRNSHSQTALLCAQQQVSYYRDETTLEAFSLSPDTANNLRYSQLLQDVLRSYQHYHGVKRKELEAGKTSKTLTWYCISGCNGIGDRVLGMYAAFLLAVVTNRTFFIHQSDEVKRTMFLEPSSIDWRPIHKCAKLQQYNTLEYFGQPGLFQRTVFGIEKNFSLELSRLSGADSIYISGRQGMWLNIKGILHSEVLLANLSPLHLKLLHSVLKANVGAHVHSFITVLHQYLFRLPQQIQELTELKLSELKLEPRGFVTVQVRTGFKNSLLGEFVTTAAFFKGERFARTKASWRNMIDCALKISDSRFGRNSTILVTSDDREPKNWAASEYKSRVAMLDIVPVHVADKLELGVFQTKSNDVYLDTWVELSVMSQSSAIVGIYSGYAEVAKSYGTNRPCLCLYLQYP